MSIRLVWRCWTNFALLHFHLYVLRNGHSLNLYFNVWSMIILGKNRVKQPAVLWHYMICCGKQKEKMTCHIFFQCVTILISYTVIDYEWAKMFERLLKKVLLFYGVTYFSVDFKQIFLSLMSVCLLSRWCRIFLGNYAENIFKSLCMILKTCFSLYHQFNSAANKLSNQSH